MRLPGNASDPSSEANVIRTPRLELVLMSITFMVALARRDLVTAAADIGATVPAWLADELQGFVQFRLAQLSVDPSIHLWLGRVMVLPDETGLMRVVGSVGFHGPPDAERRLEVGYSVDPPYRRQGFARESVEAMFDWAYEQHGITRFVASISPTNEPSLRLAAGFGFVQVGEQIDEIDGLELVFETTWPRAAQTEGHPNQVRS